LGKEDLVATWAVRVRDESCGLIDIVPWAQRDADNQDNVRAAANVDVLGTDSRHVHACWNRIQHNAQSNLAGEQSCACKERAGSRCGRRSPLGV
jgi:hypothetical protein